jgi:hypothetical protein
LNKKALVFVVALLAVTALATPLLGIAEACRPRRCRTVETFTVTPFEDPSTFTNMEELNPATVDYYRDGTVSVAHGTLRKHDYNGPLGTGTFYIETLLSVAQVTIPYSSVAQVGRGFYKYTLVIDDGPYGTGTLTGYGTVKYDYNLLEYRYEQWDTATMIPVKGHLDIVKVSVEGYGFLFDWWWTTTTVVS